MCVLVALTLGCVRVLPPLRRNNPFGVARGQLFEPVLKLCAGDTLLRGWRKRQSQRSGGDRPRVTAKIRRGRQSCTDMF